MHVVVSLRSRLYYLAKAVFTLGARVSVPGDQHKIMLHSDTGGTLSTQVSSSAGVETLYPGTSGCA